MMMIMMIVMMMMRMMMRMMMMMMLMLSMMHITMMMMIMVVVIILRLRRWMMKSPFDLPSFCIYVYIKYIHTTNDSSKYIMYEYMNDKNKNIWFSSLFMIKIYVYSFIFFVEFMQNLLC
jgi:hypothetical protein